MVPRAVVVATVAFLLAALVQSSRSQEIVISTTSGRIRGQVDTARNGSTFYVFKGIPFAERPQRFEVAQPKEPWDGIRDALEYGSNCPQVDPWLGRVEVFGDEDCLFLNVFFPTEDRCGSDKLPVVFHIHGGSFTQGSGDMFNPKYLMDGCIVYVSTNYRLGAYGFLTMQDEILPGNIGLKDALLALKWTRDNLEAFRGDKDAVTLNGISAGGGCVSYFIASPATKGLFHRAIAQSGFSLGPSGTMLQPNPKRFALGLGQLFNCTGESSLELRDCLRAVDIKDIVLRQNLLWEWYFDASKFLPVIESAGTTNAFLLEDPYLTFKHGRQQHVPYIVGTVQDEGLLLFAGPALANSEAIADLNANWNERAPLLYQYNNLNLSQDEKDGISAKIKDFYFQNRSVGPETAQGLIDLDTDRYVAFAAYEECKLHSQVAPTYLYLMTYQGDFSLASVMLGLDYIAVTHGHETPYIYNTFPDIIPDPLPGSERLLMSNNIVKLWLSFIQTGVPTDLYGDIDSWRPFTFTRPSTLQIELPPANIYDSRKERMDFWESFRLREKQFPEEFDA